ncbi:MAG: VWA domain-containing protein [Clostridiales bacterium]|jgi:uncharacterized protein YegL|nr:VWA domain-containing protein [Clostridiales bacterium]
MARAINPLEVAVEPAKKELVIFFIIDRSGSMSGTKIGAVNTAIREVLPVLRGIGGSDANIKIAVLGFSTEAHWISPPVSAEEFMWEDINAVGWTDFGAALNRLCEKMSRREFLNSSTGYAAPVCILMSDGQPTDSWLAPLELLRQNNWFKLATKIAIAIGNDADKRVLTEFTGNPQAVLVSHSPEDLKKLIKIVTLTSSQIGSKNTAINVTNVFNDRNAAAREFTVSAITTSMRGDPDLAVNLYDDEIDDDF